MIRSVVAFKKSRYIRAASCEGYGFGGAQESPKMGYMAHMTIMKRANMRAAKSNDKLTECSSELYIARITFECI